MVVGQPARDFATLMLCLTKRPPKPVDTMDSVVHDPFVVGTVIVPAAWLGLPLLIRHKMGGDQSSGADLLGLLLAFDCAALIDPSYRKTLARTADVAAHLEPLLLLLLLAGLIAWIAAMVWVEPALARWAGRSRPLRMVFGAAASFCDGSC